MIAHFRQAAFISFFSLLCLVCSPTVGKTQEQSLWRDLGLYGGQIYSIAVHPDNSSILYAGSWGGDGLFKSRDGGGTWSAIPSNNPSWFRNCEVNEVTIDPNNPSTVWVADGSLIEVSRDSGATWETFYFADDEDRYCYTVAVDPHDPTGNTVYAGTGGKDFTNENGEIFITTDGGETWNSQGFYSFDTVWNNFWKIAFNPNIAGEVWVANRKSYASPDGFIYVSPDYGQTWWFWEWAYWTDGNYYALGYIDEIVVNPADPLKIFASSGYGIARKLDGANLDTHWEWTDILDGCSALCIPPAEPETIYAGLPSYIAKSTDSGETWDMSRSAPDEFLSLQSDPFNAQTLYGGGVNRGIFKTIDGAQTWESVNKGIKANTIYDTDISSKNPSKILCGTLAGVYLTTDKATWNHIHTNIVHAVAFHPEQENTLYAGTGFSDAGWSLEKSMDNGGSWWYISADAEEDSNISAIAVLPSPPDNDTVLAGVSYSSGKQGALIRIVNWGYESYDDLETLLETATPVNAVAVDPRNRDIILAGAGSFYFPIGPGGLFISRNGGSTWNQPLLLKNTIVNSITFAQTNPDIIYVACGASGIVGDENISYAGIFKSTNGGQTWERKTNGLPPYFSVSDIKVDSRNSDIVYAAVYQGANDEKSDLGGTYISLDGGEYWTRVGLSDYLLLDINSSNVRSSAIGYATASNGHAQVSIPSSTILAGTASGLYMSTTAGTGIVTGSITAVDTGESIDGALITTPSGAGGQSTEGYYLVLLPSGIHSLMVTAPGYVQISVPSVAVSAGQSVAQNIQMTTASSDNTTNCLATVLLQGTPAESQLNVLRTFRDQRLAETPLGRSLISRYYALGRDIRQVLQKNPRLHGRCVALMVKALPLVQGITANNGRLSLPPSFMDEVSSFLFDLEQVSPAGLQKKINTVRNDLRHTRIERMLKEVR